MNALIQFKDVTKTYRMGETVVNAVDGITFEAGRGEFVIIVGPAWAGRSSSSTAGSTSASCSSSTT